MSTELQANFVETELETGHKMLEQAIRQRSQYDNESASQSLSLARLALSGAQEHLDTVKLPRIETKEILQDAAQLRKQIESFERTADTLKR
jgi:hypothetical protein